MSVVLLSEFSVVCMAESNLVDTTMSLLDCYLFIRFCTVWDKGKLLVLCKVLRAFCLEN